LAAAFSAGASSIPLAVIRISTHKPAPEDLALKRFNIARWLLRFEQSYTCVEEKKCVSKTEDDKIGGLCG
jgi:hypothetical protein